MSDQQIPPRPHRKKKSTPLLPFIAFFALLILAAVGIFYFSGDRKHSQPAVPESEKSVIPPAVTPLSPPAPVEESEQAPEEPLFQPEETGAAGRDVSIPFEEESREHKCAVLAERLHGFFSYLDTREYMESFSLQEPSQSYFISLADRLLDNPPVVSRESDDLYTILKNMAHFFRVIGKDNILLIKTILDRERDKIEDVAGEIYLWSIREDCEQELFTFSPDLGKMYEYAGFFLNTMGGRSYLFRRDSRSRLVINYYSVLLVDLANEKGINRHGLDVTQVIPLLVEEIESSNQLIYKENYLDQLYTLLEKYQN